jgi:hypothetical protein
VITKTYRVGWARFFKPIHNDVHTLKPHVSSGDLGSHNRASKQVGKLFQSVLLTHERVVSLTDLRQDLVRSLLHALTMLVISNQGLDCSVQESDAFFV